ncbi:MAG: MFS transporter [Gammaproteobacteria bacterium]|nr:MFS transporter [Gammaproteobacteria bacterium]
MNSFRRNIPLLALCQAMLVTGMSFIVSTTVLVGYNLATDKSLATLPFAGQLLATMLTSIPAAMLMKRIGRKRAFLFATLFGMSGAALCTWAILQHAYLLFLGGSILLGVFTGFGNYYRFTAADIVAPALKSRAIAYVLAGGIIAAVIGPNLAIQTRTLIPHALFAGGYAAIISLYVISFALILLLHLPQHAAVDSGNSAGRPIREIIRQPKFIIAVTCAMLGYGIMSLLMTATPLAMQHHHHDFTDTAFVIQWHVLGMFAPAFVTGHLIRRFGLTLIMASGLLLGVLSVMINLNGSSITHFWLALFLLGVSWNFLFIGGTTLLTETYTATETFKTQAVNDLIVFTTVSITTFSAGMLQHHFGWRMVNYGALPALFIILMSLIWLYRINRERDANYDAALLQEIASQAEQ